MSISKREVKNVKATYFVNADKSDPLNSQVCCAFTATVDGKEVYSRFIFDRSNDFVYDIQLAIASLVANALSGVNVYERSFKNELGLPPLDSIPWDKLHYVHNKEFKKDG